MDHRNFSIFTDEKIKVVTYLINPKLYDYQVGNNTMMIISELVD